MLRTATLYGWRTIKGLRQVMRDGSAGGGMGTAWGQLPLKTRQVVREWERMETDSNKGSTGFAEWDRRGSV